MGIRAFLLSTLLCVGILTTGCESVHPGNTQPAAVIHTGAVFKLWVSKDGINGATGSGVAYKVTPRDDQKYDTYLLTANHVVSEDPEYIHKKIISNLTPGISYDFSVISRNSILDICIIKATIASCYLIPSVSKRPLRSGDRVLSVAYPIGIGPVLSEGLVCFYQGDNWAVSCSAFYGSSGGAVFDIETGDLVGIIVSVPIFAVGPGRGVLTFFSYIVSVEAISQWEVLQ